MDLTTSTLNDSITAKWRQEHSDFSTVALFFVFVFWRKDIASDDGEKGDEEEEARNKMNCITIQMQMSMEL
ncbi:CLUMA_CG009028, isoform A [Clunio marinus]|uniref:CLUMA_CG009028, isoform A n=1 Tax=Clunio marinus TaxID=568069 RepID=A0A1J1I7L2_9DIPT|nr:CLUMA_CG009028, isoform A [Clunio marinus]